MKKHVNLPTLTTQEPPQMFPFSLPLPLTQDWFSSHLKQLVMELSKSGTTATDGANMSTASSSHFSDDDTIDLERAPLDLTE